MQDPDLKNTGKKEKRICILTFFYKPAGGGIPRYVDEISQFFVSQGHKVDIITASYDEKKKIERKGKMNIYRLPYMLITKDPEINKNNAKKFLKFIKAYSNKKPDIFVAQSFHSAYYVIGHSLALNMISIEKNIPLALTVHSFLKEDESKAIKSSLIKDLYWDKVICIGPTLAESLFNNNIPSESIYISLPPVNTEKFRPGLGEKWLRSRISTSEKDFVILIASRTDNVKIAEEKGIFTALRALSHINEKNIKLLVATAPTAPIFQEKKDEAIKKIRETAKLLGIERRVMIETFNPDDMPLVYNGVDLSILPSEYENCSLFVSESMSCKVPAITTGIGGLPDITEAGKTGEIINVGDHVELSKKIKELVKAKAKLKKFGEYGRELVINKQDIEKIGKNLLGVYESIIIKRNNLNSSNNKNH